MKSVKNGMKKALLAKLKESEQLAQRASMTDDERAKETALAAQDQGMAELVAQREKAKIHHVY